MRVLLFQAGYKGHVLKHLRLLLEPLCEMSQDIVVTLSQNIQETAEFKTHLASFTGNVSFDFSSPPELTNSHPQISPVLLDAIQRHKPDHVYVPQADGIAQNMGVRRITGRKSLPRDIPVEGLMFRGSFAYPQPSLSAKLKVLASLKAVSFSRWSILHYMDPFALQAIERRSGYLAHHVRLMPDPVETPPLPDKLAARRLLGIPETGRYIGFAGGADRRKGADLLLLAFLKTRLAPTDRLFFLGPLTPEIKELVKTHASDLLRDNRLLIHDRYVSDEQLLAGISAVDVVATPYPRHIGSASFVIRAAAANRPVVAADFGWIGSIVRTFNLGRTCNVEDPVEFATAITQTLESAEQFKLGPSAQRFVQFHGVANCQNAWMVEIRRRLGLVPPSPLLTWDWVNAQDPQTPSAPSPALLPT